MIPVWMVSDRYKYIYTATVLASQWEVSLRADELCSGFAVTSGVLHCQDCCFANRGCYDDPELHFFRDSVNIYSLSFLAHFFKSVQMSMGRFWNRDSLRPKKLQ
jgi:hypothetical protein